MRQVGRSRTKFSSLMPYFLVIIMGWALSFMLSNLPVLVSVGALLAAVFCILFLGRPDYGLLVVLLVRASTDLSFSFLGPLVGPRDEALGGLPNIVLILLVILLGGFFVFARRIPVFSLPGGRLMALLLLVGIIGTVRADSHLLALKFWLPILSSLLIYAMTAYLFRSPRQLQRVIDVIAMSFVVPAIVGFSQLIRGEGVVARYDPFTLPRIIGTFVHPNPFGVYLVVMISLFLCQALFQTGRRKAVALVGLSSAILLLVGTFARVAWIGATIVVLTVGVLRNRVLLLIVLIAGVVAFALVPSVSMRVADPLQGSFASRLYYLWPGALREWRLSTGNEEGAFIVAVNRLAGLGPGAWYALSLRGYGVATSGHNDYLRMLVEFGVFGLVLFLTLDVILVIFAFRTWRASTRANQVTAPVALAFLSLTFAFPIMGITDNIFGYTVNQVYFWSFAGLTVGIHYILQHLTDTQPQADRADLPHRLESFASRREASTL